MRAWSRRVYVRNVTYLFQVHVHPRVTLDQVTVVRFSALQFNQL